MPEEVSNSFAKDKLVTQPNVDILHFEPLENGRDRFGNRVFSSKNLAYTDRDNREVKAALLVSEEGQEFLKRHNGILQDINEALKHIEYIPDDGSSDPSRYKLSYPLKRGGRMQYLSQGGQSLVYTLEVDDEKYIIKCDKPRYRNWEPNPAQPYINEMLQSQAISEDLQKELDELGISLPTFLFTSGQISCVRFEEGERPSQEDLRNESRGKKLEEVVTGYISKQQETGAELWDNIHIDLENWYETSYKVKNFIKRKDGTLVWIDPVFYSTNK